jgi:hypothetical protein
MFNSDEVETVYRDCIYCVLAAGLGLSGKTSGNSKIQKGNLNTTHYYNLFQIAEYSNLQKQQLYKPKLRSNRESILKYNIRIYYIKIVGLYFGSEQDISR